MELKVAEKPLSKDNIEEEAMDPYTSFFLLPIDAKDRNSTFPTGTPDWNDGVKGSIFAAIFDPYRRRPLQECVSRVPEGGSDWRITGL